MPRKVTKPPRMRSRHRSAVTLRARVEVGTADAASPTKPRTFRMVANTGEPMRIYPYDLPVVIDLETIDLSGLPVPALYDHCPDADFAVGTVDAATAANGELVATGRFTIDESIPPDRNYARKVLNKADAGYAWQTSIGGDPATVEEVKAGGSGVANWGRQYAGPLYIARGLQAREISFVVLGGDRRTSAVVARHRIKGSAVMSFEDWLTSMGFDSEAQSAMTEIQLANMQKMYADESAEGDVETESAGDPNDPATPPTNAEDETPVDEKVTAEGETTDPIDEPAVPTNAGGKKPKLTAAAALTAERVRLREITNLCEQHGDPRVKANGKKVRLSAHAAASGWGVNRVKSELLDMTRKNRPTGPAVVVKGHDKDCTLQALQGAMILRFGGKLDAKAYASQQALHLSIPAWLRAGINDANRNKVMEAAHRFNDMNAVDLCREACRLDGKNPGHGRDATIKAAFSGSSLTNIFTTNVNAILLATYMEAPDTTVGWVTEQDVADYKLNERPRMLKGAGLTKLPRGGEADHASRSDTAESYKIARYAKQFVIDEMDIVNDSLGALGDMPTEMALAAARLRPDLVYAILLANPTLAATARALFNATDGNLLTGAALAAAKLKAAVSAMRLFRENGVNLNIQPTHLIVPPSLEFTAYELVNSTENIIAGTAASITERGNVNSVQRLGLTVVSDSRLENGVTDPDSGTVLAGSSSTWWLGSNWAQTIEVGYLRGTGRAPQVRPFQLDKGSFGMGWDVQMAIGAKALDYKGLVESTA